MLIPPLGKGHCIFIIDYGMHKNSCWIIVLEKDRFMEQCNILNKLELYIIIIDFN